MSILQSIAPRQTAIPITYYITRLLNMKTLSKMISPTVLSLLLVACGGGGGSSGQPPSPVDPADPGSPPIGANLMCTDSAGSPSGANSCNDLRIVGASFRANVDIATAIISSLPSRLIRDPGAHGCPGGGTAVADAPPLVENGQGTLTFGLKKTTCHRKNRPSPINLEVLESHNRE